MHSPADDKVHPNSAKYIYNHVGAQKKQLIWLPQATHDPFQDGVNADVYFKILDFLSQSDHLAHIPPAPQPTLVPALT
jgi:esterase/lipase